MTSSPVELKTCDSPVSLRQTPSAPKFSPLWITIDKATSTLLSFKLKTHHHPGVSAAQRRKRFRTLLSVFYFEDSGGACHCGWTDAEVFGVWCSDADTFSDWSHQGLGILKKNSVPVPIPWFQYRFLNDTFFDTNFICFNKRLYYTCSGLNQKLNGELQRNP